MSAASNWAGSGLQPEGSLSMSRDAWQRSPRLVVTPGLFVRPCTGSTSLQQPASSPCITLSPYTRFEAISAHPTECRPLCRRRKVNCNAYCTQLACLLTSTHGVRSRVLPRARARGNRVLAGRCRGRLRAPRRTGGRVRTESSSPALSRPWRRTVRTSTSWPVRHRPRVLLIHAGQARRRVARVRQEDPTHARTRADVGAQAPQEVAGWLN